MSDRLILRLMVEAPSTGKAESVADRLRPRMEEYGEIERRTAEPYWKMPEWIEVTFYLRPLGTGEEAYDALRSFATAGWTDGDDGERPWSVWNEAPGARFLEPGVKWAELQFE